MGLSLGLWDLVLDEKRSQGLGSSPVLLGQQQLWVELCAPCPLCCVPKMGQGILVLLICPQGSECFGSTPFPLPLLCPH